MIDLTPGYLVYSIVATFLMLVGAFTVFRFCFLWRKHLFRWRNVRYLVLFFAVVAALGSVFSAHAGYAMLTPPAPLVLQAGGTTTIAYGNIAAANAPRIAGGYVVANATLSTGARTIIVPVALRVAGNAAVFAVTKLNPYVAAASLAVGAYQIVSGWFEDDPVTPQLFVNASGHVVLPGTTESAPISDYQYYSEVTLQPAPLSEIYETCDSNDGYPSYAPSVESWDQPCWVGANAGQRLYLYCGQGGMGNHRFDSGGTTKAFCSPTGVLPPVTSPDVAPSLARLQQLEAVPISADVLPWLSPDIPVDPIPVINPATQPVGDPLIGPEVNPAPVVNPAPFRVPNGDSVPIPNTNPQQYSQPWLEITPAPTAEEPWRVEVTQIITIELNPIIQPEAPFVQQPTDCDKYPGSFSCADIDDPDDEVIPRETRVIDLQNGASFSGGSCPSNLVISAAGRSFSVFDASVACGWILAARPVILLLAALSALTIIRPGGRKVKTVTSDD